MEEVWEELERRDPTYTAHLEEVGAGEGEVEVEDLLPGVLAPGEEGEHLSKLLTRSRGRGGHPRLREVLGQPAKLMARKWLSQVSHLCLQRKTKNLVAKHHLEARLGLIDVCRVLWACWGGAR